MTPWSSSFSCSSPVIGAADVAVDDDVVLLVLVLGGPPWLARGRP